MYSMYTFTYMLYNHCNIKIIVPSTSAVLFNANLLRTSWPVKIPLPQLTCTHDANLDV